MPDTEAYALISFETTGDGDSYNLSGFFAPNATAKKSYQNVSWQLIEVVYGYLWWSGPVDSHGRLLQGDAPDGFVFTDDEGYPGSMELQVLFNPDPCQPCCPNEDNSGQNCCPASPTTPGSVELATGRFVFNKDLLSAFGLGAGSWNFEINYKSNYDINGILGKGFAYPQYMFLEQLAPHDGFPGFAGLNNIQLTTNQLSRAIFTDNGDGTYSATESNNTGCTLKLIGSGSSQRFRLTASNGTITTFFGFSESTATPGQIESIVDRFGNSQNLAWTISGTSLQLESVTDSYGRIIRYEYLIQNGECYLQQITDFLGRKINFQYDTVGHLVAVITPSIVKAVAGNTFPGGTAYVFQFDITNGDPNRRDDLIRIWYPNETQQYLDPDSRFVDVLSVYAKATPRYKITYGQNSYDTDTYGKVLTETCGDPENEVGGTSTFGYTTCSDELPSNLIDPDTAIVNRTVHTDRNGNIRIYDFNAYWTVSRLEIDLNRKKNSLEIAPTTIPPNPPPFVTWTKFNAQNQPLVIVHPEGNSTEYLYDLGTIDPDDPLLNPYIPRRGLLLSESRLPGNSIGISSRSGSNGQVVLTRRYFYEPIFNQLCATVDERGNPIDGDTYFTPQNGGTTPTNANCSRYATIYTFDYQKDMLDSVTGDGALQSLLGLNAAEIGSLISYVNGQMTATDGTGGIPTGFPLNLGDINGDGTGDGASSGLPHANHLGSIVKTTLPSVLLVGGATQARVEIRTSNLRGQVTTLTDPEGNLTVTTRYPENDPEGTGQNISTTLSTQQYGLIREIHLDADPR